MAAASLGRMLMTGRPSRSVSKKEKDMLTLSGLKKNLRKFALALVLGASLVTGLSVEPAVAREETQPSMSCGDPGTGDITLEMPFFAPGRLSQFYYSVDGGAWQKTDWYYSDYGKFWQWDGWNWARIFPYGYGPHRAFSGSHRVHAYEFNGWSFTYLGYCDTSSIDGYGFNQWN
jgi:hypothetical protein